MSPYRMKELLERQLPLLEAHAQEQDLSGMEEARRMLVVEDTRRAIRSLESLLRGQSWPGRGHRAERRVG